MLLLPDDEDEDEEDEGGDSATFELRDGQSPAHRDPSLTES
jgi:hypothetical protein